MAIAISGTRRIRTPRYCIVLSVERAIGVVSHPLDSNRAFKHIHPRVSKNPATVALNAQPGHRSCLRFSLPANRRARSPLIQRLAVQHYLARLHLALVLTRV